LVDIVLIFLLLIHIFVQGDAGFRTDDCGVAFRLNRVNYKLACL
jgi:hypothetical protein